MAQPTQLTPTEQDALVKQIGLAMLRVAPEDWEQLTVDYRAVGRYAESTGRVVYSDGATEPWTMPADLQGLFARLRAGMYREGRGTWFNARYRLDQPSSYNLEYDREEPVWDAPPPPQAYPDDMRLFPRTDDNVPDWLRRRLAAAPPPPPPPPPPGPPPGTPPRFRVARIFDGPGEDGRPSVNRPQVDEIEIQDILDYLDNAPLVGPARGYDTDRLDPNGQQSVPVAFHTDGTWIWPAAVNYYLREHDISPETDLVDHIRRMRFQLPQVDEQTRNAAQMFLGPPPPPGPGGPRPGPPAAAPTRAMPVPAPAPAPKAPPRAALPSQGSVGQELHHLRTRLDDLDVPETAYRIGAPSGRGWTMEQSDEGWRVGWYDRDWVAPAVFEDVADASAFLLGKLMLDTDRWAAGPNNPELPPPPEDHGFEPLAAPIEDYEPMAPPAEDYAPAARAPKGPVGPPPGTPGYPSPPPPGFTPPPRGEPAHTMAMEPPRHDDRDDFGPPMEGPGRGDTTHDLAVDPPGREPRHGGADPLTGDHDLPAHGLDSGRAEYGMDPLAAPRRGDNGVNPLGHGEPRHGGADPLGGDHDLPGRRGADPLARDEPGLPGRPDPTRRADNGIDPLGRNEHDLPTRTDPTRRVDNGIDPLGLTEHDLPTRRGDHDLPSRTDPTRRGDTDPLGRGEPHESRHGGGDPDLPGRSEPAHGLPERGEPLRTMAMEPARGEHALSSEPPSPPRGEQTVLAARPANGAAAAPPGSDWPIAPLPGEPPLTLFRGKRVVELEPGTEIDRFGDDDGNLVYAAGTPFAERSLVPEWIDRPYHAYRVRQPVQVLTGAAIPWFDQPGGGTAYLLPDAIGDLVAHGHLVEINDRDRPRA